MHEGKCITVFSAPNYWYVQPCQNAVCACRWHSQANLFFRFYVSAASHYPRVRSNRVLTAVAHASLCVYSDQMGNKGAFIHLDETCVPKFTTFDAVPHPNVRPMAYAGGYGSMFGM